MDIGPATIDLQVVRTIKGDDNDATVGPKTGFAAKITGNLGNLSLSAGGDVVLTGATDTTEASTDYELGASLGIALTDTTGIIENLSLALSWGLYDLNNGNPDNEEDKGHNDKLDMMVGGAALLGRPETGVRWHPSGGAVDLLCMGNGASVAAVRVATLRRRRGFTLDAAIAPPPTPSAPPSGAPCDVRGGRRGQWYAASGMGGRSDAVTPR